jgi:hypothetical protein
LPHNSARPGSDGGPIFHAHRQQHAARPLAPSVAKFDHELVLAPLTRHHLARPYLDARIRRQFATADLVQLGGRPAVVAQQPADAVRRQIALIACVDDEGVPPRPAEHQSGAQPGRAAADDDAVPNQVHVNELAGVPPNCQAGLPCRQTPRKASTPRFGGGCANCAQRGLTLEDVASRSHIDVSTLSRLESGKRRLALATSPDSPPRCP